MLSARRQLSHTNRYKLDFHNFYVLEKTVAGHDTSSVTQGEQLSVSKFMPVLRGLNTGPLEPLAGKLGFRLVDLILPDAKGGI